MYDMHYDLLTILYFSNKNKANFKKVMEDCKKIYREGNIQGGIINLYFMSKKEMLDQLNITSYEIDNLVKMFERGLELLQEFKKQKIIPQNIDFIYELEGCDFLSICDLEKLYNLGLRIIAPVWNNENRYGSGNRTNKGLTEEGANLINKAIDLNMGIDVSHANEKTFEDILNIIKQNKEKKPIVMATHSNVKKLCNKERNLSDIQLKELKDVDGYIGLVNYGKFISLKNKNMTYKEREEAFLEHLDYLINKIEFREQRIMISTDDMNFEPDTNYHNLEVFKIETINSKIREALQSKYSQSTIENILVNNPKGLIEKLKNINKL